ncbi:hypothetical protein A7982_12087 [Minicystis rosea]|nr:hypothetical protein A7982_12087 [Minicystis rosea]
MRRSRQQLDEQRGSLCRDGQDHDERQVRVGWQTIKERRQRLHPTGRGPDAHDGRGRSDNLRRFVPELWSLVFHLRPPSPDIEHSRLRLARAGHRFRSAHGSTPQRPHEDVRPRPNPPLTDTVLSGSGRARRKNRRPRHVWAGEHCCPDAVSRGLVDHVRHGHIRERYCALDVESVRGETTMLHGPWCFGSFVAPKNVRGEITTASGAVRTRAPEAETARLGAFPPKDAPPSADPPTTCADSAPLGSSPECRVGAALPAARDPVGTWRRARSLDRRREAV